MTTPNIGLTELANGQANFLNANEAFAIIDALLQTPVISKTLTAAPGSPANGALYIMASAWAGTVGAAAGRLALYRTGSGWIVITPKEGWKKEVLADGLTYRYDGADWLEWIASSSTAFADITGSPGDNTALAAALAKKADAVQDNLSASVPPTVDNDETEGYEPRSRWFDIVAGESYLCLSADDGAAVWVQTSLTLDELGSAALVDVGTGATQVPRNSDLGSAAYLTAVYALAAANHTVDDAGNYYTSANVEGALQEVGAMIGDIDAALDAINGEVI